jgi:hypothetical protein
MVNTCKQSKMNISQYLYHGCKLSKKIIIICSNNKAIKLWNIKTDVCLKNLDNIYGLDLFN